MIEHRYRLELLAQPRHDAEGRPIPEGRRLALALKDLLRRHGFRCVMAVELTKGGEVPEKASAEE